jgi:hypothetical protein
MELVDAVCKNFEDYAQAKSKSSGEPVIIRSGLQASLCKYGKGINGLTSLVAVLWIVDRNRNFYFSGTGTVMHSGSGSGSGFGCGPA